MQAEKIIDIVSSVTSRAVEVRLAPRPFLTTFIRKLSCCELILGVHLKQDCLRPERKRLMSLTLTGVTGLEHDAIDGRDPLSTACDFDRSVKRELRHLRAVT